MCVKINAVIHEYSQCHSVFACDDKYKIINIEKITIRSDVMNLFYMNNWNNINITFFMKSG